MLDIFFLFYFTLSVCVCVCGFFRVTFCKNMLWLCVAYRRDCKEIQITTCTISMAHIEKSNEDERDEREKTRGCGKENEMRLPSHRHHAAT